jgi:hypothetical protein
MISSSVTTVQPHTQIRRERLLPHAGEIVVNMGQQVSAVQIVARASRQRGFTIVPAAEILGVAAADVPNYLLVEEGAAIQKKKPLLEKRSLFGSKSYSSPVNGILYQVDRGRLILQHTPDLIELRAVMQGFVSGFLGNRGVIIETHGALIQAAWSSGPDGVGTIQPVVTSNRDPLLQEHIGVDARGAILVAGYLDQRNVLEAAEESSVRGIIVGSIPSAWISSLSSLRFPVIVTEGFQGQHMASPIFELLQQNEGREASLLASSGIAHSQPEIIIPLSGAERPQAADNQNQPLQVGQRVRLLRAPYAGMVGKVTAIHSRARTTEVGYRVPGADVVLAEGQKVFVPYPNLDMIR